MQTGLQTEVVLCPNCKEDVPKTLYCLNCGYPLYKMELDKSVTEEAEDVIIEVEPEPFEAEAVTEPIEEEVTVQIEEAMVTPTVEEVFEAEETEVVTEPEELVEATEELGPIVIEEAVEVEMEQEPIQETVVDIEVEEEASVPEAELEEEVEEVPTLEEGVEEEHEVQEIQLAEEEAFEETIVEEPQEEPVVETVPVFEPEPVIKEVMENLAKNLSTKIKLVNLLLNNEVKLETFNRLFESYNARGELLMNSRNEMMERVRFDLDAGERALNEAKIGLEELGIRRTIGDVSEEEYKAKSPGFEWDIAHYEDDVEKKKAEIAYLEEITQVMPAEEIDELKEKGQRSYDAIDSLKDSGTINSEMAAQIKVMLQEALACLKTSNN